MMAQSDEETMTPEMFIALVNTVAFLGMKDARTRDEELMYSYFLDYAGTVARYNTLVINEEIGRKLDGEYPHVGHNDPRATQRVA